MILKQTQEQSWPNQPYIEFQQPIQQPIYSQTTRSKRKHKEKSLKSAKSYQYQFSPKIIQQPLRNPTYEQIEHQRQLKNLKIKLQDIKNNRQRVKDNSDPFLHPVYFLRKSNEKEKKNKSQKKKHFRRHSFRSNKKQIDPPKQQVIQNVQEPKMNQKQIQTAKFLNPENFINQPSTILMNNRLAANIYNTQKYTMINKLSPPKIPQNWSKQSPIMHQS